MTTAHYIAEGILAAPFILVCLLYLFAAFRDAGWPARRIGLFVTGTAAAVISVLGPIPRMAHDSFVIHMTGHLLLGMLAPLCLVLAAPVTLALRALPVPAAKKLAKMLRSRFVTIISHPVTATVLNIGGLWFLYTTGLYALMHASALIYIIIHVHIFLAGYAFTASIIYIDPMPHRYSFLFRSGVLVAALAGHGILSKYLYVSPPAGVGQEAAQAGSMLMYYGGDAVDIAIMVILCWHWYKAARPREEKAVAV
ncbi:cytochrome c oxidase assembly protein [Marinococcus halophilus]|uniref:Membrane protein n=1 Tax=Marinococcus halophilus TaxID=1371 RepID=A0A510YA15_MARHA|nr:cytochrome c oxidase assembly protein [Marinococcus halophilus]OZT78779.1 cytochrome c oxidase assembly protein [Marinococcus halophilus]GEK60224.1 membrane protein [Marinococcus halophilus]